MFTIQNVRFCLAIIVLTALASASPAADDIRPAMPTTALKLHERENYRVEPPDIVGVEIRNAVSSKLESANGQHRVSPDGEISLGDTLGDVYVAGKTVREIQAQVERLLVAHADGGSARIWVEANNSRVFYIIYQRPAGDSIALRMPCVTGEERVGETLRGVEKPELQFDGRQLWIARPAAAQADMVLMIDWNAIQLGDPATDHTILPGDRIFIHAVPGWIQFLEEAYGHYLRSQQ